MGMSFTKSFDHNEALYETAVAEFVAAGYEQASINTILKKAGMSKGQFYYHFKNKEDLYLALTDIMIERKKTFMTSVMKAEDLQQDIFSIFKTQIEYGIQFAQMYPEINAFSDSFLKEKGNPIYETAMTRHNFENNDAFNMMIAVAYEKGDFREELPLSFVQKTIGYLFTHIQDFTDLTDAEGAQEQLNYLVDFMRKGLAREP